MLYATARTIESEAMANARAFERELPELLREFRGKWVVYYSGCLVAFAESRENAKARALYLGLPLGRVVIRLVDDLERMAYLSN